MKKIIITIVVIVVLGVAYWLISPLFIDNVVSEEFPAEENGQGEVMENEVVYQGEFEGFDSVHYGSGTASVIKSGDKYVLRFEEDFDVANGPDLFVGFGKAGEYVEGSDIARLKGNVGSQNYELDENIDLSEYDEVWVWCRAFSVGFAKAKLSEI